MRRRKCHRSDCWNPAPASDTRGVRHGSKRRGHGAIIYTHSSLQAQNKFKVCLVRGWDTMIWNNMKQKWECSPILEQENLLGTKLPHELVSSREKKTYWGLIYKYYKSQKHLMRLQFKQSPLVLMKNSHVSSAKIFEDFPRVGEPWRFTCVSFGTALTTASKKGHFSCQNCRKFCRLLSVGGFSGFLAWKKDGWNKRHSKHIEKKKHTPLLETDVYHV